MWSMKCQGCKEEIEDKHRPLHSFYFEQDGARATSWMCHICYLKLKDVWEKKGWKEVVKQQK